MEEDYPGQNYDVRRQKAIEEAVRKVMHVILEASDGSVEESNYLEAEIGLKIIEQVVSRISSQLLCKDLEKRHSLKGE